MCYPSAELSFQKATQKISNNKSIEGKSNDILHYARIEWSLETIHWLLGVRCMEDYFRAQNENIQKNMNISRKLALNFARIYKNKNFKKIPLPHIMFDCLMDLHHLLTVLGKN